MIKQPTVLGGFFLLATLAAANSFLTEELNASDFDADFVKLSEQASRARERSDWNTVEQKRWERWNLVKAAAKESGAESPIIRGYLAIEKADGTDEDPGLVNNLKYDEAIAQLVDSWEAMCAATSRGPVLGEVAARIFEVVHQRDAVKAAKGPGTVDAHRLLEILTSAERLDPCCISVIPMIEWLKPLDPKEAFLRAEVRPSFKARQAHLLGITHPLQHALVQTPPAPPSPHNDKAAPPAGANAPVLPWHAPAEYLKAQSLQKLIEEPNLLEDVLENWRSEKGLPYIIPRTPLKGTDASGNKCELLYGQLLITTASIAESKNKKSQRRTVAFLCDERKRWQARFLDILWCIPTPEELKADGRLKEVGGLIDQLEILSKWEIGTSTLCLCRYPVHQTERLLAAGARVLCVKDAMQLPKLPFRHARNDPLALTKQLDSRSGAFNTDPEITAALYELAHKNDKTKHSVLEVAKRFRPLVVMSRSSVATAGPNFFLEQERPYLRLQDGAQLFFDLAGEESPSAYRETEIGTFHYPMNYRGIPDFVFAGSGAGRCAAEVLREAGLSDRQANDSVVRWVDTGEIPEEFQKFIDARALSRRVNGQNDFLSIKRTVVEDLVNQARKSVLGHNSASQLSIPDEVALNFFVFGYRYFRDRRGNITMASGLGKSLPGEFYGQKAASAGNAKEETQYLFTTIQPNGKQIQVDQLYSWNDFADLKQNIFNEYLAKALLFEPSFGTYGAIADDARTPLIHPENKKPAYLRASTDPMSPNAQGLGGGKQVQATPVFVKLERPIQPWKIVNEEPNQLATLTSLHNAYCDLIWNTAYKMQQDSQQVATKGQWNEFTYHLDDSAEPLVAIQWESARNFARDRYFHRAIVYYNDLLKFIRPAGIAQPHRLLLDKVPNSQNANKFIEELTTQTGQMRRFLALQTELAGVLRSAGLTESAQGVFGRTVHDYEHFMVPTLEITRELLASYGIQPPPGLAQAADGLREVSEISKKALERFQLAVTWRKPEVSAPHQLGNEIDELRNLAALLDKMKGEGLDAVEAKELDDLRQKDSRRTVSDFRFWLERKKVLGPHPEIAWRVDPALVYDIRVSAARDYDAQSGFDTMEDGLQKLIAEAEVDQLQTWCLTPIDEANAQPAAAVYSFLLAWYWLDQGDNAKARASLVNLGEVCSKQATAATADSTQQFVARANAFSAFACANCISQQLPGMEGARVDFTDALSLQVLMWQRQWLAAGLSPSHAAERRDEIDDLIQDAQAATKRSAQVGAGQRYFFPDYRCQFGGVPDYIVGQVLDHPELFKKVDGNDVEGNKKPIREGAGWVLVEPADAVEYFRRLEVNEKIDLEIVGLE